MLLLTQDFKTKALHWSLEKNNSCFSVNALADLVNYQFYKADRKEAVTWDSMGCVTTQTCGGAF